MSTDFRPLTPLRMADLFDGRLENVGWGLTVKL
jgi:hypothetical protein